MISSSNKRQIAHPMLTGSTKCLCPAPLPDSTLIDDLYLAITFLITAMVVPLQVADGNLLELRELEKMTFAQERLNSSKLYDGIRSSMTGPALPSPSLASE